MIISTFIILTKIEKKYFILLYYQLYILYKYKINSNFKKFLNKIMFITSLRYF